MHFFQRVRRTLMAPTQSWAEIATETTDIRALYTGYLMPLAILPALASWFGLSVTGFSIEGEPIRLSPLAGLINALAGYALSLFTIYLLAVFANRLATSFGGQPNRIAAHRLIIYSSTAALLGGIVSVVPTYAALSLLPTLYSAHLLAQGLPVMMRSLPERTITYTSILLIGALVFSTISGAILAALR